MLLCLYCVGKLNANKTSEIDKWSCRAQGAGQHFVTILWPPDWESALPIPIKSWHTHSFIAEKYTTSHERLPGGNRTQRTFIYQKMSMKITFEQSLNPYPWFSSNRSDQEKNWLPLRVGRSGWLKRFSVLLHLTPSRQPPGPHTHTHAHVIVSLLHYIIYILCNQHSRSLTATGKRPTAHI